LFLQLPLYPATIQSLAFQTINTIDNQSVKRLVMRHHRDSQSETRMVDDVIRDTLSHQY